VAGFAKLLESPYTALVVAIIIGALALSGKFTVTATHVLLAAAWAVALIGLRGQPLPVMIGSAAMIGGGLLLLGYWFVPDAIKIDLSTNEGILIPGDEPTPAKPRCNIPSTAMGVFFGSNVAWTVDQAFDIIRIGDQSLFTVSRTDSNLTITRLQIFDDTNEIIATIDADGFWVKNTSRKKRPDPSTLIVYDKRDQRVLFVRFLNPRALYIEGIFRLKGFAPLIITADAASMGRLEVSGMCSQMYPFAGIFGVGK